MTQQELANLSAGGRWGGFPLASKRAAPEIYSAIRQGTANCREWYQWTFGAQSGDTQQSVDLWHACCIVDIRVEEYLARGGMPALLWGLNTDDVLEGTLRQLASAREFKLHGDSQAARALLAFKRPGDSVVPQWLQEESRAYSTAMHKQGLRTRGGGGGGGQWQDKGGKGKDPKGKGKGKDKGKDGGAAQH